MQSLGPQACQIRDSGGASVTGVDAKRGVLTGRLWIAVWLLSAALVIQGALEVLQLGARWPVWLVSVAPIIVFLFGVARDSLQWFIWYCLLLLFYFVGAVEDVFARPDNYIVVSGLIIVVLLFSTCTAYIRFRGRERRALESTKE